MDLFDTSGNWIIAMGKTILHSLWIGLIIFSALKLILYSIPDRLSNLRYQISLGSLFLLLGSVVSLFILLYAPGLSTQDSQAIFRLSRLVPPGLTEFVHPTEVSKSYLILFDLRFTNSVE